MGMGLPFAGGLQGFGCVRAPYGQMESRGCSTESGCWPCHGCLFVYIFFVCLLRALLGPPQLATTASPLFLKFHYALRTRSTYHADQRLIMSGMSWIPGFGFWRSRCLCWNKVCSGSGLVLRLHYVYNSGRYCLHFHGLMDRTPWGDCVLRHVHQRCVQRESFSFQFRFSDCHSCPRFCDASCAGMY